MTATLLGWRGRWSDMCLRLLYPEDDQRQRAEEYAEYMNKIVDAMHQAYENNQLMDVLKGENNGSCIRNRNVRNPRWRCAGADLRMGH